MKKKDVMRPIMIETIMRSFDWKGTHMIWRYTLNGNPKKAVIYLKDLIKIIKWETR